MRLGERTASRPFPLSSGSGIGFGLGDVARSVTGCFMDGTRHFARRGIRITPGLLIAGIAIEFAGPIDQRRIVFLKCASRGHRLANMADITGAA